MMSASIVARVTLILVIGAVFYASADSFDYYYDTNPFDSASQTNLDWVTCSLVPGVDSLISCTFECLKTPGCVAHVLTDPKECFLCGNLNSFAETRSFLDFIGNAIATRGFCLLLLHSLFRVGVQSWCVKILCITDGQLCQLFTCENLSSCSSQALQANCGCLPGFEGLNCEGERILLLKYDSSTYLFFRPYRIVFYSLKLISTNARALPVWMAVLALTSLTGTHALVCWVHVAITVSSLPPQKRATSAQKQVSSLKI